MKQPKNLLWDLDGVLFPADQAYHDALVDALAIYISRFDPKTDETQNRASALDSNARHHSYFKVFSDRYALPFATLAPPVYAGLDISFMRAEPALTSFLAGADRQHAVITTSSLAWATRVVAQLGFSDIFPAERIIACADLGFGKTGPEPYALALQRFNFAARETAMIEDTEKNLRPAKELGLMTVLVANNASVCNYVDYGFQTVSEMIAALSP